LGSIRCALQHPEAGQAFDLSAQIAHETGIEDASVKLIAWNGYGDRNIVFSILQQERPDAIFHFTDPRYWTWLYALEHEIKTTYGIPLFIILFGMIYHIQCGMHHFTVVAI
jgi:hypothetical protein